MILLEICRPRSQQAEGEWITAYFKESQLDEDNFTEGMITEEKLGMGAIYAGTQQASREMIRDEPVLFKVGMLIYWIGVSMG